MSKANEKQLSNLHGALAELMQAKLESGTATAGDMGVIRAFLKDNGIEALPGSGGSLDRMAETLAALEKDEGEYLHS